MYRLSAPALSADANADSMIVETRSASVPETPKSAARSSLFSFSWSRYALIPSLTAKEVTRATAIPISLALADGFESVGSVMVRAPNDRVFSGGAQAQSCNTMSSAGPARFLQEAADLASRRERLRESAPAG